MIKDFEIKTSVEIKTSLLFNLVFADKTILSGFFSFSLLIALCFLIPVVIGQIFNSTGELAISIGVPAIEIKVKIETHPVVAETKRNDQ